MLLASFSSSGRLWPLCLYCWLEFWGGSGDFVAGSSVHASTLLAIAITIGPGCIKEKTTNYNCMSIIFSWNCSRITEVKLGREGQEGSLVGSLATQILSIYNFSLTLLSSRAS